ncbi:uncharacterized protein LOC126841291 [Adelges cooleyi]|uniref:uncharacterized protein LOC126841291 n=1 Tax=Adelges cooleyi TaxID=133065 RepID=UPI00217F2869|nr:uncharacterized protein LOC126841291 [Adelges cooleyi]
MNHLRIVLILAFVILTNIHSGSGTKANEKMQTTIGGASRGGKSSSQAKQQLEGDYNIDDKQRQVREDMAASGNNPKGEMKATSGDASSGAESSSQAKHIYDDYLKSLRRLNTY